MKYGQIIHCVFKYWQNEKRIEILKNNDSLYQFYFIYLIIYAGERNDFIKNIDLIFKSRTINIIKDYYK